MVWIFVLGLQTRVHEIAKKREIYRVVLHKKPPKLARESKVKRRGWYKNVRTVGGYQGGNVGLSGIQMYVQHRASSKIFMELLGKSRGAMLVGQVPTDQR